MYCPIPDSGLRLGLSTRHSDLTSLSGFSLSSLSSLPRLETRSTSVSPLLFSVHRSQTDHVGLKLLIYSHTPPTSSVSSQHWVSSSYANAEQASELLAVSSAQGTWYASLPSPSTSTSLCCPGSRPRVVSTPETSVSFTPPIVL